MDSERFGQRLLNGQPWIQAGERILEDHLDIGAQPPKPGRGKLQYVHAVEIGGAGGHGLQPRKGPPDGRLPASALADEAQDFARGNREGNSVDRLQHRPDSGEERSFETEVGLQIPNLQQRRAHAAAPLGK